MASVALLAGALLLAAGCATTRPQSRNDAGEAERLLAEGLGLYDAGEFVRAATRFGQAADGLRAAGSRDRARDAVAAECTAWLRARQLRQLDECSEHLGSLVRRARHSDPGMNTLIALGAVAGDRPLPPFRLPNRVQPLVRAVAAAAGTH